MKKYKWWLILVNLCLLLVYFNYSVAKKETLLKDGTLILLELAPVDPRSLMQGDYMDLRYKISQNLNLERLDKRGFCIVKLLGNGVGEPVRLQKNKTPLATNEYAIAYTLNDWQVNIGAESFFFQEGEADKYTKAKYGAIKVDKNGNNVLVGLFDEKLNPIK